MQLHHIIENRIKHMTLYDKKGNKISTEQCQKEYHRIRLSLLKGYTKTDILGIYLDKDYHYILTMLACMSIKLPYIPLTLAWPEERIEQIVSISGCKLFDKDKLHDVDENTQSIEINHFQNSLLYIMFTSGSTGEPKGVQISRTAYTEFLIWAETYFKHITMHDKMLLTTDFTFDISLLDIALLLMKNVTLYMSNFENNIFKLLYEIEKYQITTHSTVPYNYTMVMHDNVREKANLTSLKNIILAGSRFPINLYTDFKAHLSHCNIYNAYGPTEGTIYCTIHKMHFDTRDTEGNNVTIGKPFPSYTIKLIDEELYISGGQLMDGYLNYPEKTDEVIHTIDKKRFYATGDVVFKNNDNNYFVTGRKDDTIKVTGYRINLSDIDAYIQTLAYINNVATIAIENLRTEHDLISYLILNTPKDSKAIKNDFKQLLAHYQLPKSIIIVDTFPLSSAGKICKKTLKQTYLNTQHRSNT